MGQLLYDRVGVIYPWKPDSELTHCILRRIFAKGAEYDLVVKNMKAAITTPSTHLERQAAS